MPFTLASLQDPAGPEFQAHWNQFYSALSLVSSLGELSVDDKKALLNAVTVYWTGVGLTTGSATIQKLRRANLIRQFNSV